MTKKLLVVCGAFLAMGLAGCGLLNPTESTSPTVTIDNAIDTIQAGNYKNVTGKVEGSEAITSISYSIQKKDGSSVATTVIKAEGPQNSSGEKKLDLTSTNPIKITVDKSAESGTYTLVVSVTAGASASANFDFYVKGDTTPSGTAIETVTLNAGANENTSLGSSIDLDAGVVYKMADAASHVSAIDLCYAHASSGADKLGSPSWAKASGYDFAKNWSSPQDIKFYKTDLTVTQFNAITTKEEIAAKWTESSATAQSYAAAKDDVFIVKTTSDATALVLINDQTTGSTGSITIKVAK